MSWLTEGPRGRRLLWELVVDLVEDRWHPTRESLRGTAGAVEPVDDEQLMWAFADSVTRAMYWQPPDEVDAALADLGPDLEPVEAAFTAPDWWSSSVDLTAQVQVVWEGEPPTLTGAEDKLTTWYDGETRLERTTVPRENGSGHWWSVPTHARLARTSRPEPGLRLVEDDLGWEAADLLPVAPTRAVRVFEVDGPEDWCRLVALYPLEVSASRAADWGRSTGASGLLLMPDHRAVSRDWDGVHVTARGYLRTATRALPVGDGLTVLAGWDPDQTWWLTDCLEVTGPATRSELPQR